VSGQTWPTGLEELDDLLVEIEAHARRTFGADLCGAYLVGSFALGDADEQSDCDFLVVVRRLPDGDQQRAIRELWAELPTRPGKWTHDLEGSYALLDDLTDAGRVGRPWFFVDHGHTTVDWDDHCNREVVRWTLREHGIAMTGAEPRTFVAPTPPDAIRDRMRRDLATLPADVLSWAPTEVAWTQRYLVSTCARVLYSLVTGEVTSKRMALEWARLALDPRWEPLLVQVHDDRARGWDPLDPPRPGSLDAALEFATWCQEWAGGRRGPWVAGGHEAPAD
jgi:predicted nucleotidyltransferase